MRKYLFLVIASIMAISAFAQEIVKVRVYKGETIAYEENYADVDSIVFVHEITPVVPDLPEGALIGEFSVSETKKVHFSKGNLQATYKSSKWTWAFAENQWNYIGNAAANNAINGDGTVSVEGTVDLFGWSTVDTYYGINNSKIYTTYSGDFVDWGKTIGGDWYTLSRDEWVYLFHERDKADELFGFGTINGVNGTIILPDNWTLPEGAAFNNAKDMSLVWQSGGYYHNNKENNYSHNSYNDEQWSVMEANGAVFLPAAGYRSVTNIYYAGSEGTYWSTTIDSGTTTYYMYFYSDDLNPQRIGLRYDGRSVRVVYEVK